jgi:hypothetical protein
MKLLIHLILYPRCLPEVFLQEDAYPSVTTDPSASLSPVINPRVKACYNNRPKIREYSLRESFPEMVLSGVSSVCREAGGNPGVSIKVRRLHDTEGIPGKPSSRSKMAGKYFRMRGLMDMRHAQTMARCTSTSLGTMLGNLPTVMRLRTAHHHTSSEVASQLRSSKLRDSNADTVLIILIARTLCAASVSALRRRASGHTSLQSS